MCDLGDGDSFLHYLTRWVSQLLSVSHISLLCFIYNPQMDIWLWESEKIMMLMLISWLLHPFFLIWQKSYSSPYAEVSFMLPPRFEDRQKINHLLLWKKLKCYENAQENQASPSEIQNIAWQIFHMFLATYTESNSGKLYWKGKYEGIWFNHSSPSLQKPIKLERITTQNVGAWIWGQMSLEHGIHVVNALSSSIFEVETERETDRWAMLT